MRSYTCENCGDTFHLNDNIIPRKRRCSKGIYGGFFCPKCKSTKKKLIRKKYCQICNSSAHNTLKHFNISTCSICGRQLSIREIYWRQNKCSICSKTINEETIKICRSCGNPFTGIGNKCHICSHTGFLRSYKLGPVSNIKTFRPYSVEIEAIKRYETEKIPEGVDQQRIWFHNNVNKRCTVGTDGSLHSDVGKYAREFRLGIFRNDTGLIDIGNIVRKIRHLGFRCNNTCGMHIHVDVHDYHCQKFDFSKTFPAFSAFEPVLFCMVHPSRIINHYCKKFDEISNCDRFSDRYSAINFNSLNKYGTIELRLFSGSTQASRVTFFTYLSVRMVDWILKNHEFRGKISLAEALNLDEKMIKYAKLLYEKQLEKREIFDIEYKTVSITDKVTIK